MLSRRNLLLASSQAALTAASPALHLRHPRRVARSLVGLDTQDGAGVRLKRVIGQPALPALDPFLLLDRLHSDEPGAYIRGFPDHPHRGFETVTVMLAGQMRHRDNRGNAGVIVGGGAQWMTAGRGIVHSEMPAQERGLLSGYQLWINLPAKEKMCAQAYQDLAPERLARAPLAAGGSLSLIAGRAMDRAGPVAPRPTSPLLAVATLEDDAPLDVPVEAGSAAFVFVQEGRALVEEADRVEEGWLGILSDGDALRLRADGVRTVVLIAAARPLGEPIARRGPFVMNTEAELRQAFADYRSGAL